MSNEPEGSGDENSTAVPATETDEDKRRAKLAELARRRAEQAPRMPAVGGDAPAGQQTDRRARLRELLDRDDGRGDGDSGGRERLFDQGVGRGGGGLRSEILRRALQSRLRGGRDERGDADGGAGPLLRRLMETDGGGEERRGGSEGRGRLLRRLQERGFGGEGRRGGSDREAELEERVRSLEAELKRLREAGGGPNED